MATGRLNFMPEPGRLELREYELPEVGDGAVLLRVLAAGVCGSELHTFNGHHPMRSGVLGHEMIDHCYSDRRPSHHCIIGAAVTLIYPPQKPDRGR